MAKTAKRRGRPPGSKNRKKVAPTKVGKPVAGKSVAGKSFASKSFASKSVAGMDVGQLKAYIEHLEDTLAAKVQQQREILEGQLAGLQGYVSQKAAGIVRTVLQVPRTGQRAKPKPKYQSRKNKSQKWSGRGMLPVWMRDEMKGTKLTKDDFLIK